ncbi:hypothetical protein J7U46_10185 [Pelomonas sp. V22]|uniref:hypothetical protein n=1 Tax=Pelomonas sp. V22 TaxID=2822139 RepID=UPI0024A99534|nr:hypothetical protein [Pelomonas sp. V22]MDI4633417.1 hypothetical protein [Pelomonas sp. V22]
MKNTLIAITLALAASLSLAHGDAKPQHGGTVQMAEDLGFELVNEAEGLAIYLTDHGKAFAATGISGKLTLLAGGAKQEAELKPAADGKLLRAAGLKAEAGAKLVAVLNGVHGKTVTVRWSLK